MNFDIPQYLYRAVSGNASPRLERTGLPTSRDGDDYGVPGMNVVHVSSYHGVIAWLPILKRDEYLTGRFVYIYEIDTEALDVHELIDDPDPMTEVPDSWVLIVPLDKIPASATYFVERITTSKIPDIPFEDGTFGYDPWG